MGQGLDELVSVVVPVFNVEEFLEECLESVVAQTYSGFEVIIVDDGSTDTSGRVADGWAARDSRIRVIHQKNAGLSQARNAGVASSVGGLISFLDGDDWWDVEFLGSLVDALRTHPQAGLAMSSYRRVPGRAWAGPADTVLELSPKAAIEFFAGPHHAMFTTACAKVYRRQTLEGITFPAGRLHEDEFTTYRALLASNSVMVPAALYSYRQRESGISGSPLTPARQRDAIDAADTQANAFLSAGHVRAAAWAQDQAFRKRLRLIALLDDAGLRSESAHEVSVLAQQAKTSKALPRPRSMRFARSVASLAPRTIVFAYALKGRLRGPTKKPLLDSNGSEAS